MLRQDSANKIQRLANQVEDVAVLCSFRLWDHGHNGSPWFHPSVFINNPPGYGNINNTIKTPNGEVFLFILSRSGHLIDVDDGWLTSGICPV